MKRDDKTASVPDVPSASREGRSSVTLMLAVLDTTWRMFAPSIGFMLLGVWLDDRYESRPWLTVSGAVFGLLCSVLLVKKQLREVMLSMDKKEPK